MPKEQSSEQTKSPRGKTKRKYKGSRDLIFGEKLNRVRLGSAKWEEVVISYRVVKEGLSSIYGIFIYISGIYEIICIYL